MKPKVTFLSLNAAAGVSQFPTFLKTGQVTSTHTFNVDAQLEKRKKKKKKRPDNLANKIVIPPDREVGFFFFVAHDSDHF